jgi:hypothetical protein
MCALLTEIRKSNHYAGEIRDDLLAFSEETAAGMPVALLRDGEFPAGCGIVPTSA